MSGTIRIWSGAAAAGALALLPACAERQVAAPVEPRPAPPHVVLPPPPPPAAPAAPDWRDVPLTPGDWSYSAEEAGSRAEFGVPRAAPVFTLSCDRAAKQVRLSRSDTSDTLVIRTSYGARSVPGRLLAPADPVLDEVAFSRGRFTVEAEGKPVLVIPAWPEPARVIEDCRG